MKEVIRERERAKKEKNGGRTEGSELRGGCQERGKTARNEIEDKGRSAKRRRR